MGELRSTGQRKTDVLTALGRDRRGWLATATPSGRPHLIAVSQWWDGEAIVVTTVGASRTARNLSATGQAKLALGSPDDVILIDAHLENRVPVRDAGANLAEGFAGAVGWDPREIDASWEFFTLRPRRIQAYLGYGELEGRDVMRDGRWLE